MKELDELILPAEYRYTESHEWTMVENGEIAIGITDYAQDQLGDIVYVELPEKGTDLRQGDEFGSVESVKAVSDLIMPVGGLVTAVNPSLDSDPGLVNSSPYTDGWMIKVVPADPAELDGLMSSDAYLDKLKG